MKNVEPTDPGVAALISLALRLAQQLQDCGHNILTEDILDGLAGAGLVLFESFDNTPGVAYLRLVESATHSKGIVK